MSNKVAAVIVVYYPKINDINVLCKSLLCQVHSIVIIDNNSNVEYRESVKEIT